MTFAIGQRVRVTELGHAKCGETIIIRAFRSFDECPGLEPWPCFDEGGALWPVNPEWLVPSTVSADKEPAGRRQGVLI